ncbi:16364_t:CDS:2 [Racocetra fulgida]|uniref:16364_t:CDS:1 n=1 Tax=Racocetra fulgida TaxID=60492 RepID=A0A9N8YS71_9GLOM|nr:16364_t:CDS:2 [Racocetra fulgida]
MADDWNQFIGNSSVEIVQGDNGSILGCAFASFGGNPLGQESPSGKLSSVYNAPLAIGTAFVAISYVISKTGIVKFGSADKPDAHDHGLSTSETGHDHGLSKSETGHGHGLSTNETGHGHGLSTNETGHDYVVTTDGTEKSCVPCSKIFNVKLAPSVYDIFRAGQFFITTALISIPNISEFYRDLASKLSWLCALPNSFNLIYLSSIADNGIRIAICRMSKTCKTTTDVTYNSTEICDLDSNSGFYSFAKTLSVPSYNLFFLAFMAFLSALALAIGITLLIWVMARYGVCLYNKWKILQTSDHKFIYGALYTQYKENNDIKDSRIWFFIITFSYDFSRGVITGLTQDYNIIQVAGLIVTELVLLILLSRFKPFKTRLMNVLNICSSVLRLLISLLLITFIFVSIQPLETFIYILQFMLVFMLLFVILLQLITTIRNSCCKKKESENDDNEKNN